MRAVRDAATVMLVRDRPGLEVLVLRRNPGAVFVPGAYVFPGGGVDELDTHPTLAARTLGLDDDAASRELGLERGGLARWHAAARECFEEAGILLPVPAGGGRAHVADEWRHALNRGEATWGELLEAEDLVLDARALHVVSHWLTPIGAPRRYDTWFFAAVAPDGQEGVHDDVELVESAWYTPHDALARYERGELELIFPTWRSLVLLAGFATSGALFGALRDAPRDAQGRPIVVADSAGERVALPGDDLRHARTWTVPLPDLHPREGVA